MDFIQQAQQSGAPASLPLNIARIPSPMHMSSAPSMQGMGHSKLPVAQASPVIQSQGPLQQAAPMIQLPDQIFSPSPQDVVMADVTPQSRLYHSGVARTEDARCTTPSNAMQGMTRGGTPVSAVTTPSNVATTHWRTMVCPMPPVKRRPLLPSLACQMVNPVGFPPMDGGSTPDQMPSPANLWPSMPSTPINQSLPSTPVHQSVNGAFPSLEGADDSAGATPTMKVCQPHRFNRLLSS
eukprot:gnl/MRDRNA2_/MRDRNA2_96249_c0_seq1.p1 gnl/MRDRNA2_/MRDRNA2_96249_c0~~gnl/MRDRNA2_/MRDRNA2_96249_c0_seq1.p1  ORF type:complete len:238 (+),score=33.63 gnl/MRDRNA2_/MRDRNA2_96249_c0_seq1:88-801(+)